MAGLDRATPMMGGGFTPRVSQSHVGTDALYEMWFRSAAEARTNVERHVTGCEVCAKRLERFKRTFPDREEPRHGSFDYEYRDYSSEGPRLIESMARGSEVEPTAPTKPMVLVVESDKAIRVELRQVLQALGHEVEEASDGVTAMEIARTRRPGIAIVDVEGSGMDGYEVARLLRERAEGMVLVALAVHGKTATARTMARAGFRCRLVGGLNRRKIERVLRNAAP